VPVIGIGHSIGATMLLALAGGDLWLRPPPGEIPSPLVVARLPFAQLLLLAPPTGYFPQPFSANAPVSVWVGANDTLTPPAQAERLAELLASPADVHVVPGADHFSFLHVAPPVPRQESAELAPGFLAEMTATLISCAVAAAGAAREAQHPPIRLATDADIPALQAVGIAADRRFLAVGLPEYADGTTIPTDAAQRAIARGDLWVAERSGVVGWILLGRVGGECCVGQVSVDPAFGRAGIGTALLRHALAVARRRGEGSVVLFTEANVPWNGPWYEREGFRRIPEDALNGPIAEVLAAQRADLPAEKRAERIAMRWVAEAGER
jgi:GNAT superfamily N-acetyltransferase